MMFRNCRSPMLLRLACLILPLAMGPAAAADVLVFAAASLKPALDAILDTPKARGLGDVAVSYAASSQLARQIDHAAPAAIFISADTDWMDHLEQGGHVVSGTRSDLLHNALVLVAPEDSTVELAIGQGFDLVGALGADGRLAMGAPDQRAGRPLRQGCAGVARCLGSGRAPNCSCDACPRWH